MMSIFTRLFGRQENGEYKLSFVEAQRRVLDYARFLENSPPMPGRVVDESRLPHPKQVLKSSLLNCIGQTDDERLGEHLKSGYLMLSAFQPNVGEQELGTDFAKLDLELDPMEVATLIELESERTGGIRQQVQAELEALQQELYALELALLPPQRLSA